jgi:hypothetical protein
VMTLVAGMPHFACQCPDGHIKPVCLGTAPKTSGCCCGGVCCSSEDRTCCRGAQSRMAAGLFQKRSCCHPDHRLVNDSPGKEQAVGPRGCTRIVTSSEIILTLSHGKTAVGKDLSARPCPRLQAVAVFCPVADSTRSWQSHQVAPPTDLITTLQRLLI